MRTAAASDLKEELMMSRIRRALHSAGDRGASAVEYGLMVAAIAAVIVGVVFGFGKMIDTTLGKTSDCISQQGKGDPYPDCNHINGNP
jgi:pilus assembly protein Flp/PilA